MAYVWIIESGEYSDRMTLAVADSLEAAVDYLKREHSDPERKYGDGIADPTCIWSEPRIDSENENHAEIRSTYRASDLTIDWIDVYELTRYELVTRPHSP